MLPCQNYITIQEKYIYILVVTHSEDIKQGEVVAGISALKWAAPTAIPKPPFNGGVTR